MGKDVEARLAAMLAAGTKLENKLTDSDLRIDRAEKFKEGVIAELEAHNKERNDFLRSVGFVMLDDVYGGVDQGDVWCRRLPEGDIEQLTVGEAGVRVEVIQFES